MTCPQHAISQWHGSARDLQEITGNSTLHQWWTPSLVPRYSSSPLSSKPLPHYTRGKRGKEEVRKKAFKCRTLTCNKWHTCMTWQGCGLQAKGNWHHGWLPLARGPELTMKCLIFFQPGSKARNASSIHDHAVANGNMRMNNQSTEQEVGTLCGKTGKQGNNLIHRYSKTMWHISSTNTQERSVWDWITNAHAHMVKQCIADIFVNSSCHP